jgi:hypothetical protein
MELGIHMERFPAAELGCWIIPQYPFGSNVGIEED